MSLSQDPQGSSPGSQGPLGQLSRAAPRGTLTTLFVAGAALAVVALLMTALVFVVRPGSGPTSHRDEQSTNGIPNTSAPPAPESPEVTVYHVTGTVAAADILVLDDQGREVFAQKKAALPWRKEFPTAKSGEFYTVKASTTSHQSGEIACRIVSGGGNVQSASSAGSSVTATCGGG